MPLPAEIEGILAQVEAINARAAALCAGRTERDLSWRTGPGRWSIAENLIHLRMTTDAFLPGLDQTIADAHRRNLVGEGPFDLGMMGRIFVWYVVPPPRIRLPAPMQIRPVLEGNAAGALSQFLESQQQMMRRVRSAAGLDLGRVMIASPFASIVRMNLFAFFSVFVGHSQRHMWQASKVRDAFAAQNRGGGPH